MRNGMIALVAALGVAIPTVAFAGDREAGGAAAGAATGAATGAVVGGPVGAAVGAGVGGVVGAAATPDKRVRTYVTGADRASVTYEGDVVVGRRLPERVEVYSVPDSDYSYTVVNEKRYIVNSDREIVEVVE
ncbi:DUF1236 domain-containing protein [Chenggangzhangella methanolivorans]|uniref:DUF1236 domain-containing protein n=1 Tax=Chenggangzhangella methanolivorans TaxID=1437009 RepID=A0A9E6RCE3_9HYPH|nr:DUF1236 domain-containing protein [Chenggangzhangella methanolivorans]QZO00729.1 DUF1236 domain-containing protein [Chenggangzhangella methanolivorans]